MTLNYFDRTFLFIFFSLFLYANWELLKPANPKNNPLQSSPSITKEKKGIPKPSKNLSNFSIKKEKKKTMQVSESKKKELLKSNITKEKNVDKDSFYNQLKKDIKNILNNNKKL